MTTLRLLLAAALLPLAACSVSTDDLKPVGPGDCAPGTKPCGYKCVSIVDPASGCGGTSCAPCAGAEPFCDTTVVVPACRDASAIVCTGTEVQCDGVGVCEDLATDISNCGACGHPCEGPVATCDAGVCGAKAIGSTNSEARGVAYSAQEDAIYWLDTLDSAGVYGRLRRWKSSGGGNSFGAATAEVLAEGPNGPDDRPGSPALSRIATNPLSPQVYLAGWRKSGGGDFQIFRWDGALTPVTGGAYSSGVGSIDGLAAMGSWVGFSRSDVAQPQLSDGLTVQDAATGSVTPPYGMAGYSELAFFGYFEGVGGGRLAMFNAFGQETVLVSNLAVWPTRVALYMGGAQPEYAWAGEQDGSVWRWVDDGVSEPQQIHLGDGLSTQMEIAMDAAGVYWLDRQAGTVWEWRHDGTKFELARGVWPEGIAVDSAYVYFTDNSAGFGELKRVPK